MSTYHIPNPHDLDIDHAAAHHEERRRRALNAMDVGDVLSVLYDLIASGPEPQKHPCFPVVNWLLDRQLSVDGGTFWAQWKALALAAIDRLVDERLQGED